MVHCTTNDTRQKPPLAQINPVEDEYFGIKISDPYRYMENLKDTALQRWFKEQTDYSRSIMNSIPGRQNLIDKMFEFNGRNSSQINRLKITDNDRYFYLKTTPTDETGKLYYRDGYDGNETLLYDPEKHSADTTPTFTISFVSPSYDGSKIAFSIAPDGSEIGEILIINVENLQIYPERIDRHWWGLPSWLPDGNGFFYNRMQSGDIYQKDLELDNKIFLHKIGTDPATDIEFLSRTKNPELGINSEDIPWVAYNKDCHYLFAYVSTMDGLSVYYAPCSEITNKKIAWEQLFKPEDEVLNFFTTDKEIYVFTQKDAPNFQILKTTLLNPDLGKAEVAVPEDPYRILCPYSIFRISSEGLFYSVGENGVKVKLYFLPKGERTSKEIELPFSAGTLDMNTKGYRFKDVWISISGWTNDSQRYRYSTEKNEFTLENLSSKPEYPEYADLIVEELMIQSYDGQEVPLSLVYKKNFKKDGKNSVFFYGYGAYGTPINPFYNPNLLLWAYNGGILAIPHVRGGGELGHRWYKGGLKVTKPNTWKDLIACAEYLVSENYTSPKKIAIYSFSAGGILIGRAMTDRPDLFAVAISDVGVMNPLRFEETPNGTINVSEFGTVQDSIECMALIEMDSYLNIKDEVKYPATLITAGINDPRVIAWQPAKYAARLQAANISNKPILFWADFEAGHGAKTKTKEFERLADVLSFAFWQTGHPDYQIK